MRLWPILAIAYLVIGIGCYIAILKFLRPQPLISTREHTDSAKGEGKNRVRVRRWNSMLVLLIGLSVMVVLSPLFLGVGIWGQAKNKRTKPS